MLHKITLSLFHIKGTKYLSFFAAPLHANFFGHASVPCVLHAQDLATHQVITSYHRFFEFGTKVVHLLRQEEKENLIVV